MSRRALVGALLVASTARAHVGANPSKAVFATPPAPSANPTDGGLSLAPYTFASADASYTVKWTVDTPNDPTGRFAFYWMPYVPPSQVTFDQVQTVATAIPEASGDNAIWVSCSCDGDAGVTCPDAGSRVGKCGITQFTWNTSSLAAGTYWLLALNNDPPYQIYTVAGGPVRVAHGGAALPPASIVVLPDGLFAFDQGFRTLWISTGQAPLHFNLTYGVNDPMHALDTPKPLGTDITPIKNADGSYSWDWDLSLYTDGLYWFGVEVSDATGQKSQTRSWLGCNVYHPPKDGGFVVLGKDAAVDLAAPDLARVPSTSDCAVEPTAGPSAIFGACALALLAFLVVRTAVRRR
jgi:hypothetical protein